jgi:hypothetical protein
MSARRPSLSCSSLAIVAIALSLGCTMEQDLGHDQGVGSANDPNQAIADDEHAGFGTGWACPVGGATTLPLARDLACPMSLPQEGDACPFASSAPCSFDSDLAHTVCVCTSDHRWSCLQGIWFRTLKVAPLEGEACIASIEVARPCGPAEPDCEVTCRCVDGAYRCAR